MSDRASADLFARFFEFLAVTPDERSVTMAKELWASTFDYDFSEYQLDADRALITLGLAKTKCDPDKPAEETVVYAQADGSFEDDTQ